MRQESMRIRRLLVSFVSDLKLIKDRIKVSTDESCVTIQLTTGSPSPDVERVFNKIGTLLTRDKPLRRAIESAVEVVFDRIKSIHSCCERGSETIFIYFKEGM